MWWNEKLWKATGYYLKGKSPVHTHNKKYITFPLDVKPHGGCDLDLSLLQQWAQKQIYDVSPTGLLKSWTFPRYVSKKYFKEILQNFSHSLQAMFSRTLFFFLSSFFFIEPLLEVLCKKTGCKIPIKAMPVEQQDYFTCFSGCNYFLGVPG